MSACGINLCVSCLIEGGCSSVLLSSFLTVCICILILGKLFHLHRLSTLSEIITVLRRFTDSLLYGRHCAECAEMNKSDTVSAFGTCLSQGQGQPCHQPSKDQHSETAVLRLFANLLYQARISNIRLRCFVEESQRKEVHIPARPPKGKSVLLSFLICISDMETMPRDGFVLRGLALDLMVLNVQCFLALSQRLQRACEPSVVGLTWRNLESHTFHSHPHCISLALAKYVCHFSDVDSACIYVCSYV